MEDEEDLTAWIGKPPPKAIPAQDEDKNSYQEVSDSSNSSQSSSVSDASHHIIILKSTTTRNQTRRKSKTPQEVVSDEDDYNLQNLTSKFQHGFYVDVPTMDEDEKEDYQYLPGHFSAKRILGEFRGGRYLVKLESGEKELISTRKLFELNNGPALLAEYQKQATLPNRRRRQRKDVTPNMVDWTKISLSDSGDSQTSNSRRKKRWQSSGSEVSQKDIQIIDDSSDEEYNTAQMTKLNDRRSSRLIAKESSRANQQEMDDFLDDSDRSRPSGRKGRRRNGTSLRTLRTTARSGGGMRSKTIDSSPEPEKGTRRSERTLTRPRHNMRERQEDEISAHSEEETGPKVIGAKEFFEVIPTNDPFRKRHRQECDTCNFISDSSTKGPLVFCQGCTNAHHKSCLGSRTTRDHLVTKVAEIKFILQCRRCLGLAHTRDATAPHHGVCAGCNKPGALSKPLRPRLTIGQEQAQREENGGRDPITIVDPATVDNIENVMFRCALCFRAWHMHHLPERKMAHSQPDDEDEDGKLDDLQLAQKRFDLYHRSWTCKDCIENKFQIDVLVAWRPVDLEAYTPGVTGIMMEESKKEYLIKWRLNSYLNTKWMPGAWVWGVAAGAMRSSFLKKEEHRLPRMTTHDAIPEDFFRIDIVFDVHYTSVVKNSTKEIDLARVGEVKEAFVKYKGLGYEDAIWENPPNYTDTERWKDFKVAYEDYVAKLHVSIPPQSTLRRHLLHVRSQDFGSALLTKIQPPAMTGGQMMQYQMEGLNWLYYQWFCGQNAILADEMGLGKTIQLIAFFALLVQTHKCWPFLVVVPNSTCPNWRREIRKWAPSLRVVTYYGSSKARHLTREYELFPKDPTKEVSDTPLDKRRPEVKDIKAHIVVVSYDSIIEEATRKSLMKVPWQGLVVDEGQRLKNDKNLLYDCLSKFKFPFKVLLTGTPLQNNVRELFNLMQFLDRSMSAAEMEVKYAQLTEENISELHEQLRKFFLRRTKAQVLTFLPPMAQIIIPVTMSTVQKKVYKSILAKNPQLMKSIFSRDGAAAGKERPSLNNILMQLRKTLCHPFVYSREIEDRTYESALSHRNLVEASSKLQLLELMLPKLKERGHRVLLFSQFLDNLDIVEDFLDGLGLQHRRLDGRIAASEKQKRIDEFNAPDSPYFAFLLSTRAGGVGINLATADTVIILDPDFNPHQDIQALSRAHRIGQKQKVLVFQLMTRDSAEEKIMQIGRKKMALDHILIERMDQDEDAGVDLESILRYGAAALFDDDGPEDIVYDSASVDRLLDRSQVEDTKISEDKSAESQFSFARVWANKKSGFDEGLGDETGTITPIPDIWDKILKERERAYAEELARRSETLGRGKRKRQAIDYGSRDPTRGKGSDDDDANSDTDFLDQGVDATDDDEDEALDEDTDAESKRPTVRARPFKRVRVPTGVAPYFSGDGTTDWTLTGEYINRIPPPRPCPACHEIHSMGWCRLKIAGVEHCGLCGLAHLGHMRTCPHLNSEGQVITLLQTLKESTESRELVEAATKYLRSIRGDLVQRKRNYERRKQEMEAQAKVQPHPANGDNKTPSNSQAGFAPRKFGEPYRQQSNGHAG